MHHFGQLHNGQECKKSTSSKFVFKGQIQIRAKNLRPPYSEFASNSHIETLCVCVNSN